MTTLRPAPARAGACPRCEGPLDVDRIRYPGWRVLLDGTCERCRHRYLQDLPSGHGLVYPGTLDVTTGETFDPAGATWFSGSLRPYWEQPDARPVELTVDVREPRDAVVLLNCLDPIYGHALLKLLNVRPGHVVVVPAALLPLVPGSVTEVWSVDAPVRRFGKWLVELEERWNRQLERFEHVELHPAYPHPHPSTYDVEALVAGSEPERFGDPSIVLSLRDDRPWGDQARNVGRLRDALAEAFPDAAFTALGVGESPLPDGIRDLRAAKPTEADERHWLALMRGADLAIGVHGSNLLLPSGLARATIELVGEERYGNLLQGTLIADPDPVVALWAHRVIYGDAELTDVAAERVAAVAVSILREGDRPRRMMTGHAAGQGEGPIEPVAASPVPPPPPEPKPAPAPLRAVRQAVLRLRDREKKPDLPAPPVVLTDRRGLRFELVTTEEIAEFTRNEGHFEAGEIEQAVRLVGSGSIALDVGANIGAFTAALANAGAIVHAFEPLAATRARLERTLELNGLTAVVDGRALSDADGTAELFEYGPGYESWATLSARTIEHSGRVLEATPTTVQTTTLAAYLDEHGIEHVDLLKIDVEGAELLVLRGTPLDRVGAILVEVSDNTLEAFGARAVDLIDLLERSGFRTFVVEDRELRGFRIAGPYRELANVFALR